MGTIRKILEKELVKGGTSAEVYPITHTRAVFNDSNVSVEELLKELLKEAHLGTLLNNYRLSGMVDSVNSRGSEYYKGVPCFVYALPSGYYPNFLDEVYHKAMGLDRGITVSTTAIFSIFITNDGVYWSSLEVPYKVIDNLTSTNSTIPLSAAQGKVLKDLIDNSIKASTANLSIIGNNTIRMLNSAGTQVGTAARIAEATPTVAGLMSAADKVKINSLADTVVENVLTSTSATNALSANLGKVLNGKLIPATTSTDGFMSASDKTKLDKLGFNSNNLINTSLILDATISLDGKMTSVQATELNNATTYISTPKGALCLFDYYYTDLPSTVLSRSTNAVPFTGSTTYSIAYEDSTATFYMLDANKTIAYTNWYIPSDGSTTRDRRYRNSNYYNNPATGATDLNNYSEENLFILSTNGATYYKAKGSTGSITLLFLDYSSYTTTLLLLLSSGRVSVAAVESASITASTSLVAYDSTTDKLVYNSIDNRLFLRRIVDSTTTYYTNWTSSIATVPPSALVVKAALRGFIYDISTKKLYVWPYAGASLIALN